MLRVTAVTKVLLAARCNVNLQNKNGSTPLNVSAEKGHESVTEILITSRSLLNLQVENGATAPFRERKFGHHQAAHCSRM